jgi:excisionase family DNA binding protein
MTDRLLRLVQVAERLDITYERAAELARRGVLPVVRLGRQIRVSPERLAEFVAAYSDEGNHSFRSDVDQNGASFRWAVIW